MKKIYSLLAAALVAMAANAAVTPVSPGENTIATAFAAAAAGDVLELSDGTYTEWGSITIDKAITFRAAEGATPDVRINVIRIAADFAAEGITFSNLSTDNYLLRTGGNVSGTISLTGCTLANQAPTPYIYLSSNSVETLTIDGCLFSDCAKNQGAIIYGTSATVTNFSMTNSTAYNCAGELTVWVANCTNAVVDHCTFYNCGSRVLYISGGSLISCAVSNCIVANPEMAENYCLATYAGTVDNCLYFNTNAPRSSSATITGCINADPLFADAANADFTLQPSSPAIDAATDGTSLGDPRWFPGAIEPEPDTTAPRAIADFTGEADGQTLVLTWINSDQPISTLEQFTAYSDDNMLTYISLSSQAESVVAADGDALTVSYHTLVSWGEGGVKILLDMPVANSFSFRLQGDGSSYAVRVYVEQNGSDWWYKNLYPGAEAEAFTLDVSNLKKLSWHNNLADESFSGENVTAIYFVASNADETTTGTFTVSGLEVAGEIAASDDYAETVILRSETDYPASLEEGTEIYRGTEASCTDELTPGTTYYYSAFAIDETGNVAEAALFTFTLPEEPVALDNTEAAAPSKLMIGGHLYIIRDGRAYSATGVRMY